MELGVYTFGEVTFDPETGRQLNAQERLRDLVEEIELADQVGLEVFAVGEHHRPDYAVSAPAVVLLIQFTIGPLPHSAVMHSIELYGTHVAPQVRAALAETKSTTADGG